MFPTSELVQLHRRFVVRALKAGAESDEAVWHAASGSGPLGWDDLLQKEIVILLGPPGSGKSSELKLARDALAAKGELAFLHPLHVLASKGFLESLGKNDAEHFQAWRSSRRQATFFLDSVDEVFALIEY